MQGEDEGERTQSLLKFVSPEGVQGKRQHYLFSAGQVRDVLPALLWGHNAEDDAFREGIHAVDKLKLGIAAEGDHLRLWISTLSLRRIPVTYLVHLLELERDCAEAGHELVEPPLPQRLILFLLGVP